MGAIEDAKAYAILIRESANDGSDFTNPGADYRRLFLGEDGLVHLMDSSGTVTDVGGSGGDVATDAIWTTAGKAAIATGTGTATEQWPPGHEFDYAELTTGTTNITASSEATADTILTGNAVTYSGSDIVMVEAFFPSFDLSENGSTNAVLFALYDGSSSIGSLGTFRMLASAYLRAPVWLARRLTPSAASHTYSIRAFVLGGGTAHVYAGAGGSGNDMPGFIRVVKV